MATTLTGKFGEPLKYTIETIKTAEETRDSIGWAYFYSRLGDLYMMEGQREEESLKWLMKAHDRFVQMGMQGSLATNLHNIVDNMRGTKGVVRKRLNWLQLPQKCRLYFPKRRLGIPRSIRGGSTNIRTSPPTDHRSIISSS